MTAERREKILEAVSAAIADVNLTLPPDERLDSRLETPLSGAGGRLDSLGLVNLVVEAEQQIEARFGTTIDLAGKDAANAAENPYATVGSLVTFIAGLLAEQESA